MLKPGQKVKLVPYEQTLDSESSGVAFKKWYIANISSIFTVDDYVGGSRVQVFEGKDKEICEWWFYEKELIPYNEDWDE